MLTSSPCIFFPFQIFKFLLILIQNSKSFSNSEREREREREDLYRETQNLENREFRRRTIRSALFGSFGVWTFRVQKQLLGWSWAELMDHLEVSISLGNPTHPTDPKACKWVRTSGRVEKHVLRKIDYLDGFQATRLAQPTQML